PRPRHADARRRRRPLRVLARGARPAAAAGPSARSRARRCAVASDAGDGACAVRRRRDGPRARSLGAEVQRSGLRAGGRLGREEVEVRARPPQGRAGALPDARPDHVPEAQIMTRLPAFLLPAALLASCASAGDRDPAPLGPDSEVAADLAEPAPPRASPLAATLASDAFRERFAASYLAETDVEPAVDAEERELLVEVMAMIAADELDEAAERIVGASSDHASAVLDFTLGNLRYQQ